MTSPALACAPPIVNPGLEPEITPSDLELDATRIQHEQILRRVARPVEHAAFRELLARDHGLVRKDDHYGLIRERFEQGAGRTTPIDDVHSRPGPDPAAHPRRPRHLPG